jgi:DNA topoisomerase I
LSLPREVGRHPEDGQPIVANAGRYGPYVQHGKTYANLESGDEVFDIGLNRAVTLIAEKLAKGPRARFGGDPGRSLGDHPDKGGAVLVKKGRYGPYVAHDGVNATLPSDKTPETITLEEALGLIAARAERTGGGKRAAGKGAKAKAGAETAKPKKAKGKAKPADAADDADGGIDGEELAAAAPAKPKKLASTARAKTAKKPTPPKPAAKPAAAAAPKRAKAGK